MEFGWKGAPSYLPQKPSPAGTNIAVQRMLQEQQQGNEPNPQSYSARLEPRRRAQFEWPPRRCLVPVEAQVVRSLPPLPVGATGLKKVTWPPPPEEWDSAEGEEQAPVYAQDAPATNGFASPAPQYAEQVSRRQGRQPLPPQSPPAQRRSASRDRRSPAWTPPPTLITLRQSPPIHQQPVPVVVSQPATARMQEQSTQGVLQNGHSHSYSRSSSTSASPVPGVAPKPTRVTAKNRGDLKWPPEVIELIPETIAFEVPVAKLDEPIVRQSGVRARGDAKWPPQEYKTRADEENAQRVALAKGPVCRPRLPKRDYSNFFEQNRVNSMYPGYRPPPGTQHYDDQTGVSEF